MITQKSSRKIARSSNAGALNLTQIENLLISSTNFDLFCADRTLSYNQASISPPATARHRRFGSPPKRR